MKVTQISSSDVIGGRFNGYGIRNLLSDEGIVSTHLVWNKLGKDDSSSHFFPIPGSRHATSALIRIEDMLSIHGRTALQSFTLPLHRQFQNADLIHYHIIHDGYFSLYALPWLSHRKPTIWTVHDPWIFTGHCIYPVGCERWQIGCGHCPRLDLPFAMRRDRTTQDFAWKRSILLKSDLEIVVASESMRRMAAASPIARGKRLHVIPFGIDLQKFAPGDTAAARARFGILPGRVVIGVRAFPLSPYKGFEFFVEALRRLEGLETPLAIITTNTKGQLNEFIGKHQIIDLGWVNDESLILDSYRALDMFVMPSIAEAFGMMAIEAMACGKPVIVFDGTSLPDIVRAPEVGVAVARGDAAALAEAIKSLVENNDQREWRGLAGRALSEELYDDRVFAKQLADLYRAVAARRTGPADDHP
jgi:glycosyltransferase involved in cell wall biosynthesis